VATFDNGALLVDPQSRNAADRHVLAAYERSEDRTLELEIARAFERLGVDVMDRDTPFHEFVNVDALRNLHRESRATPIETAFVLYGYRVTVTADRVRIYDPSGTE